MIYLIQSIYCIHHLFIFIFIFASWDSLLLQQRQAKQLAQRPKKTRNDDGIHWESDDVGIADCRPSGGVLWRGRQDPGIGTWVLKKQQ